jgi:hypothetical protein
LLRSPILRNIRGRIRHLSAAPAFIHASNQKATSKRKQFDFPKPTLETHWVAGDSASFRWTKTAFYRTVDQVTITVPDFFPKPAITLFSSGNPSDTTCVVKDLRFGNSSTYTLSVYPKTNIRIYEDNQVTRSSVSFGIGNRLSPFEKFTGDPVNGFFYVYGNGKIMQYAYPEIVKQDSCESSSFARWFVSFYDQKLVTQMYSDINLYPPDDWISPPRTIAGTSAFMGSGATFPFRTTIAWCSLPAPGLVYTTGAAGRSYSKRPPMSRIGARFRPTASMFLAKIIWAILTSR